MEQYKKFEESWKPVLSFVGLIGAVILSIAYVVLTFVLIWGFKAENVLSTTIFSVVTAAVGFVIMQFLKVQGVSFAQQIPENIEVAKQYYNKKTKDKKMHSMTYFWVTSVIKDILIKCLTLAASSVGLIYIVIQGSNDYHLLMLAAVNLAMFICFGFLSMTKAYDFYNNFHIPYMKQKISEVQNGMLNNRATSSEEQE